MKKTGPKWEKHIKELLDVTCDIHSNSCKFYKSPIPTVMRKQKNIFFLVYTEKALCDFYGIYNKRFILIEAKNISGKYWDKSRLKEHQINQLKMIDSLGGKSFIFFNIEDDDYFFIFEINNYLKNIESIKTRNVKRESIFNLGVKIKKDSKSLFLFFESTFLN